MVYVHEFELYTTQDGSQSMVAPLGHEQDARPISDVEEALEVASTWLTEKVEDALTRRRVPEPVIFGGAPSHDGHVFMLGINRSLTSIPAVTAADAAAMLGVSRSRVAQLCAAGTLENWKEGAHRMVSVRSLESRLSARSSHVHQ